MDNNRYQQDFLWFSYFGITKTEAEGNADVAVKKCIERAYLDLCRTLKYKISTTELEKMKKEDNSKYIAYTKLKYKFKTGRGGAGAYIFDSVKELLKREMKEKKDFDGWHETTCKILVEEKSKDIKTDDGKELFQVAFQYGHAQKWVNMTLKNMLVMGLWPEMEKIKEYMHIPVDSYIIDAAGGKKGNLILTEEESGTKHLGVHAKEYHIKKWSNIQDYEKYHKYQEEIRKVTKETGYNCPVDWEGAAWITQAKKEKGKKDTQ